MLKEERDLRTAETGEVFGVGDDCAGAMLPVAGTRIKASPIVGPDGSLQSTGTVSVPHCAAYCAASD